MSERDSLIVAPERATCANDSGHNEISDEIYRLEAGCFVKDVSHEREDMRRYFQVEWR